MLVFVNKNIKFEYLKCQEYYITILFKFYKIFKKDTTVVPLSTDVRRAPGEVSPGHMIFAPLRTNLIAPLSTCSDGKKNGSKNIT